MAKLVAEVAAGRHATSEHRTLNELLDEPDPLCEGVPATDVEPTEEASADFSAGQTGPFIGWRPPPIRMQRPPPASSTT